MTADEVLEAMARGILMEGWETPPEYASDDAFFEEHKKHRPNAWKAAKDAARAAIRALHERGGLVVGKMPEDEVIHGSTDSAEQMFRAEGYNDALAAVRAAAVEVKP